MPEYYITSETLPMEEHVVFFTWITPPVAALLETVLDFEQKHPTNKVYELRAPSQPIGNHRMELILRPGTETTEVFVRIATIKATDEDKDTRVKFHLGLVNQLGQDVPFLSEEAAAEFNSTVFFTGSEQRHGGPLFGSIADCEKLTFNLRATLYSEKQVEFDPIFPPLPLMKQYLCQLFEDADETGDVVIACFGGGEIRAHSIVLKASKYFSGALSSNFDEANTKRFALGIHADAAVVREVIRWLYTGEISRLIGLADRATTTGDDRGRASQESRDGKLAVLQQVVIVASHFRLETLEQWAVKLVGANLTPSTVVSCLQHAEEHDFKALKYKCLEYITLHDGVLEELCEIENGLDLAKEVARYAISKMGKNAAPKPGPESSGSRWVSRCLDCTKPSGGARYCAPCKFRNDSAAAGTAAGVTMEAMTNFNFEF
jgi:hypothetical protein